MVERASKRTLLWTCVSVGIVAALAWGAAPPPQTRLVAVVAFGAGAGLAWGLCYLRVVAPVEEIARCCAPLERGDLGIAIPESGSQPAQSVARHINGLAADFQEVLLLFAHMTRSAHRAMTLLEDSVSTHGTAEERDRVAQLANSIAEMQDVISDFKYYRVVVRGDAIVDTGVASTSDGATAARDGESAERAIEGANLGVLQK